MDAFAGLHGMAGLDDDMGSGLPTDLSPGYRPVPLPKPPAPTNGTTPGGLPSWTGAEAQQAARAISQGDVTAALQSAVRVGAAVSGAAITMRTAISPDVRFSLADFVAPPKPEPEGISQKITGWIMRIVKPEVIVEHKLPGGKVQRMSVAPYGRPTKDESRRLLVGLALVAGLVAYSGYKLGQYRKRGR